MTQENKEGKTVQEETAAQEPETAKASDIFFNNSSGFTGLGT